MRGYLLTNFILLIKSIQKYSPEERQKRFLFFLVTLISMTVTYGTFIGGDLSFRLINGFIYSFSLMTILLSHEFGHFLQAKKYGVECTLPFFIPLPFISPFGTMGAFIRIKSTPPTLKGLFDISFWGPAMSFSLSIPALFIGLYLSEVIPSEYEYSLFIAKESPLIFGSSLLISMIENLLLDIPTGYAVVMHPMAYAGWVGIFVTAINLMPVGQLDGGHIAYAFLGKTQKYIAYLFLFLLIILAFDVYAWLFWAFLLLFLGIRHPILKIPAPEKTKLNKTRLAFAIFAAFMFIVSFIPAPITVVGVKEQKENRKIPPEDFWKHNIKFENHEGRPVDGNRLFN